MQSEAMWETAASDLVRPWTWIGVLHFAQQLCYGKIIAVQLSFLASDCLPDFISALAGHGLEHERDVTRLYFDGRLSGEAKTIYDWLLDHPAQPTRELRRGTRLGDKSKKLATERALVDLQRRFLVCKVDLTGRTRGCAGYLGHPFAKKDLCNRWNGTFSLQRLHEDDTIQNRYSTS